MGQHYVSKGTVRICPFDHSVKMLSGENIPPKDKVSRDICKDSDRCNILNCPVIEAYNSIR